MLGAAVGATVRRLPRGRNRVAVMLQRQFGRSVDARDSLGLRRSFDLRDLLQAQWFCGVEVGLSPEALALVRPGSWVIDVGANVGIVTGQLCRAVGSTGRVTSLEPLPANLAKLKALKSANELTQLDVHGIAAGAATTTQSLRLPPEGNSGWASFSASWLDGGSIDVAVRPLDELVAEIGDGRTVDFVKVDVEGYEFEVVAGAERVLKEHRPTLVMEFNDPLLRDRGRSSLDLLTACREVGYAPADAATVTASSLEGAVRDVVLRPA